MPGRKFVSVLFQETYPPAEHELLRRPAPARLNRRVLIQAAVGAALAFGAAVTPCAAQTRDRICRCGACSVAAAARRGAPAAQPGRGDRPRARHRQECGAAQSARRSIAAVNRGPSPSRRRGACAADAHRSLLSWRSRAARLRRRKVRLHDTRRSARALRFRRPQPAAEPLCREPDEWRLLLAAGLHRLAPSARIAAGPGRLVRAPERARHGARPGDRANPARRRARRDPARLHARDDDSLSSMRCEKRPPHKLLRSVRLSSALLRPVWAISRIVPSRSIAS